MSKNELDKLFQKKLGSFEDAPSMEAWNTLDSRLKSKRKGGTYYWIRIAASFVGFLAVAALVFVQFNRSDDPVVAEETTPVQTEETVQPEQPPVTEQVVEETQPEEEEEKISEPVRQQLAKTVTEKKTETSEEIPSATVTQVVQKENIAVIEVPEDSLVEKTTIALNVEPVETGEVTTQVGGISEPLPVVTISYRAGTEAVSAETAEEAQPETKVGKAVNFLKKLKNGDENLVNLKEVKDGIFAFNFRKKKDKEQEENK